MFKNNLSKFVPTPITDPDTINIAKYTIFACLAGIDTTLKTIPDRLIGPDVTVLASTTVVERTFFDLNKFDLNIEKFNEITVCKKYIVVSVGCYKESSIKYSNNLNIVELKVNYFSLIKILKSKYDKDSYPRPKDNVIEIYYKDKIIIQFMQYMNYNFGIYSHIRKEKLRVEYEVVFQIEDISWDTFVFVLKSTGISVFGGFSQKRHILSTVQSSLTTFLNLCFGFRKLNEIVYHGNLKSNEFLKLNKLFDKLSINRIGYNEEFLFYLLKGIWEDLFPHDAEVPLTGWGRDLIHFHYCTIIKITSKLVYLKWRIAVNVEKGQDNLVKLSNMSEEELIKDNELILNLEKIVLELKSLKDSYNALFKSLHRANKIELLKFEEGVCLNFPDVQENIDYIFTLISVEEFYIRFGKYLSKSKKEKVYNKNKKKNKNKNKNNLKIFKSNSLNTLKPSKREFSTTSYLNRGKKLVDPIAIIKDNSPYLDYLTNEIQLAELDPKSTQINLENNWLYKILDSINEEDTENKDNNKFKTIVQFQQNNIFKKAFQTLDLRSNKIKKKLPFLHPYIKPVHVILAYGIIDIYSNFKSFTEVTFKVGDGILREIYFSEVKNKKDKTLDFKSFLFNLNITKLDKFNLGIIFVDIFTSKPTPLYIREYRSGVDLEDSDISDEHMAILVKNVEFLDENSTKKIISPYSLPMLTEPLPWSNTDYGGYFYNKQYKEDVITGQTHSHKVESREKLYNSINKLNKIKFKINSNLLKFLLGDGIKISKNYFNNLKNKSDLLHNVTTLKLAKIYNLLKTPFYIPTHADWRGRLYTVCYFLTYQGNELSLALLNLFEGQSMTEEGLVYLNIYGANNYNEKGTSKKSINSKLAWVKANYNKIINLDIDFILKAESPILFSAFCLALREHHLNPNAKIHLPVFLDATCSGIQHLSALVLDADAGKYVNLVAQTNSSAVNDIYSEMLEPINRSIRELGKSDLKYKKFETVNLQRKNIKASIMTQVYNVTTIGIKDQLLNSFDKFKIEVPILPKPKTDNKNNLNENKNIIVEESNLTSDINLLPQIGFKPEIKTESTISLTEPESKDKKKDKVRIKYYYEYLVPCIDGGKIRLTENEIFRMAQIIDNEIFIKFPSLKKIFNYLIEVAKLCLRCNIPLNWFTPAGVEITQVYNKTNKVKASITLGQKNKSILYKEMTDSLDKRKQTQAIIPNIVHSLDSAHLMLILEKAESLNIKDILTIHDCFGSHPNDMEALKKLVISEFVKIYSDFDFLTKFHDRIIQSIEDNGLKIEINDEGNYYVIPKRSKKYFIPNLPLKGHLDLKLALQSKNLIV